MDKVDECLLNLDVVPTIFGRSTASSVSTTMLLSRSSSESTRSTSATIWLISRRALTGAALEERANRTTSAAECPSLMIRSRVACALEIRRIVRQPRLRRVRIGHDGRQRLVDFMSNGRGHLGDGGDLHGCG